MPLGCLISAGGVGGGGRSGGWKLIANSQLEDELMMGLGKKSLGISKKFSSQLLFYDL